MSKLKGRVKDAAKNKKKEKQLLLETIKTIKKQIKVNFTYRFYLRKKNSKFNCKISFILMEKKLPFMV